MIDAYRERRRARAAAPAGAPELGARAGRGRGDRPRPVAQQRVPAAGVLGHRQRRDVRRRLRGGDAGPGAPRPCSSRTTWAGTPSSWPGTPALGFDQIALHHVGQQQEAWIDAFGAKVLPQLRSTATAGGAAMKLARTSDLWWKNAVVYCLDVETYADGNGDGCGDFRGLIQHIDHLARLGVTCLWLMPFFPSPGPRRRLRHHRLLRRRPAAGHPRRRRRAGAHRPRPGHAGDRRPGRQPHLGPAPLVRRGAQQPGLAEARLVRLGGRAARRRRGGRGVPRPGDQPLGVRPQDQAVLPAPVLQAPARPQRGQPRGPRRDRPDHGLLDGAGAVRVPGGRGAVPARDQAPAGQGRACPTRTTTWPTWPRSCAGATARRCCSARSTCPTRT